jgi:hypothetical protein
VEPICLYWSLRERQNNNKGKGSELMSCNKKVKKDRKKERKKQRKKQRKKAHQTLATNKGT